LIEEMLMRKLLQFNCGIRLTRENRRSRRNPHPITNFSTINLTWNDLGSKAGLRNNWLSEPWHCTETEFHRCNTRTHLLLLNFNGQSLKFDQRNSFFFVK
jgi:hypothetical protein